MTARAWLNGTALADTSPGLPPTNRGLHYGDGVFETMLARGGSIRLVDAHLDRVQSSCERLGIVPPSRTQLLEELQRAPLPEERAIVKLLVIRAGTGRGYRPEPDTDALRLILCYPWSAAAETLTVQWCTSRWSRNAQLAGLKHLNRLEQVLAQRELRPQSDEGLMLDNDGELISATSGNVFIVQDATLRTPDLQSSGVRGIMRNHVIVTARTLGLAVEECPVWPADLEGADEAFVTNAVRGIRPIVALHERRWNLGPITQQLQKAIAQ